MYITLPQSGEIMFDTKKFGAFIAHKRKNANLTQSELAEKLNLTRQAISKYEVGDSFPDISVLIQIAGIFNIALNELIVSGMPANGDYRLLERIIPFLDAGSKEAIIIKIIEGESDWRLIKALLPHMEGAVQLLEAAVLEGILPNEALDIMRDYFLRERIG